MLLRKITLNLLIIKAICYADTFNIDKFMKDDLNYEATRCIESVIRKYFPCGTLVTMVDPDEDGELIRGLNSENDCYSFIVRYYDDQDWSPTPVYVIRAGNVAEFTSGILINIKDLFWNPRGRFIIELEISKEGDVETVFKILMLHKAFDVILIRNINNEIVIDTYYPFKGNNCGKKLEVATVGKCKDIALLHCFRSKPISMNNCTVKVVATPDTPNFIYDSIEYTDHGKNLLGLEQFVLETIAEKEGIKLEYTLLKREQKFGIVMDNYTATGLLGILQNYDMDIAAGGFVLMRNRVLLFDYIWGYIFDAFMLFTPAVEEETWKDFYNEFGEETWLLIVIAFCLVVVVSIMRRKLLVRRSQNQICLTLRLWGYFYLNTSTKLSRDKNFRVVMLFWIWFTFFLINFYNTALYSLLTSRNQIKRFISVDRLGQLPYEPCLSKTTRTFFLFAFNQNLPEGPDYPECQLSDTALDYVATEKNKYAIEMENFYTINEYKYMDEHGHTTLDTWSFSTNNIIALFLTRGFPLRDTFQMYAFRIYESGILQYQLDTIIRIKNRIPLPNLTRKAFFEMLFLTDMRLHYFILTIGYVLSMLCFVLEITWHRYSATLIAKWKLFCDRKR